MATYSPQGVPIPQPRPGATPTPTIDRGEDVRSAWNEFLGDPANRAGLLQFGLSMLSNANSGETIGANFANAAQEGLAVRGATIGQEAADAAAARKEGRDEADLASKVSLRSAQASRARKYQPKGAAASSTGQMSQKDYAKEWIKFYKDARGDGDQRSVAELRSEFDSVAGAGSAPAAAPTAVAPAAGLTAAQINQMTLEQLKALDVNLLVPGSPEAQAAYNRYRALTGAK